MDVTDLADRSNNYPYIMTKNVAIAMFLVISTIPAYAREGKHQNFRNGDVCCMSQNSESDMQIRGRCGKRKGDCYGMRSPVRSIDEARIRLQEYFAERKLSMSDVVEKKWRFEAELLDSSGKVVDRVMIDKRTGRVRSLF